MFAVCISSHSLSFATRVCATLCCVMLFTLRCFSLRLMFAGARCVIVSFAVHVIYVVIIHVLLRVSLSRCAFCATRDCSARVESSRAPFTFAFASCVALRCHCARAVRTSGSDCLVPFAIDALSLRARAHCSILRCACSLLNRLFACDLMSRFAHVCRCAFFCAMRCAHVCARLRWCYVLPLFAVCTRLRAV